VRAGTAGITSHLSPGADTAASSGGFSLSRGGMFHHGMEEHIGSVVPVFDQLISGEALCVDINPSKLRFGSQVCTPDRSRSRARFSMRIPPHPSMPQAQH
jgi:hypothetical protein